MNTATTDTATRAGTADYEQVLGGAQQDAAVFDEDKPTLLGRLQHFLHAYPTMVPFLVLLIGIAAFTVPLPRLVEVEIPAAIEGQAPTLETQIQFVALAGNRFFQPFNLSLIVQQVTIIAILGIAQTLVILTAGIDLSVGVMMILCSVVMGRTSVVYGVPLWIAFPLGMLVGLLCGAVNGLIITKLRLPPFIVTLGTWSIFGALNIFYSRSETIRQQDIEAGAPFLQWTGTIIKPYDFVLNTLGLELSWLKGSVVTYGSILAVVLAALIWYLLNRTALRPPRLRDGRRSGFGAARRHQHRSHADRHLRPCRADLRDRRLGADRPHRRRQPAGGPDRQPRFHHRRGDRRHQPVRRPRLDRRHAHRRA